jgi:HEAT repeat protein
MATLLVLALLAAPQAVPDREAEAAISQFRKDYKSPDVSRRVAAVSALAKVEHLKVLAAVAPIVAREDTEVRSAAVEGLGGWAAHKPEVTRVLGASFKVEVKDQKSEMPFEPFLEAFGKLRAKSALPDVHLLFQYWDPEWCDPAVKAVGVIRCRDSVEPLIKLWQRDELAAKDQNVLNEKTRPALNAEIAARAALIKQSLKAISGQDFAAPADASKWWKDNKATFKDP